jgi:hypothetical protein
MTAVDLDPGEPQADEATVRRLPLVARVAIAVFIVGSLVMWGYALFGPRQEPPGTLDDQTFGPHIEEMCAPVLVRIGELPQAHETPDADERADVIAEANGLLDAQLVSLRGAVPSWFTLTDRDQRMLTEWLADWDTYLDDREEYAAALRRDADARMLETPKEERPLSFVLTQFAEKNSMPSCAPPGDVG